MTLNANHLAALDKAVTVEMARYLPVGDQKED